MGPSSASVVTLSAGISTAMHMLKIACIVAIIGVSLAYEAQDDVTSRIVMGQTMDETSFTEGEGVADAFPPRAVRGGKHPSDLTGAHVKAYEYAAGPSIIKKISAKVAGAASKVKAAVKKALFPHPAKDKPSYDKKKAAAYASAKAHAAAKAALKKVKSHPEAIVAKSLKKFLVPAKKLKTPFPCTKKGKPCKSKKKKVVKVAKQKRKQYGDSRDQYVTKKGHLEMGANRRRTGAGFGRRRRLPPFKGKITPKLQKKIEKGHRIVKEGWEKNEAKKRRAKKLTADEKKSGIGKLTKAGMSKEKVVNPGLGAGSGKAAAAAKKKKKKKVIAAAKAARKAAIKKALSLKHFLNAKSKKKSAKKKEAKKAAAKKAKLYCEWNKHGGQYAWPLAAGDSKTYKLSAAKTKCIALKGKCKAVTCDKSGKYCSVRASTKLRNSSKGETTYLPHCDTDKKVAKKKAKAAAKAAIKAVLTCTTSKKSSNKAGIVKTHTAGGYTMVGGGMVNHYRKWDKLAGFEEALPDGNHFRCDTGFGPGKLDCYGRSCKTNVGALKCVTKSKRFKGSGVIEATLPKGYVMTGGGLNNHYRSWNKQAGFEETRPNGNAWRGDMGFGKGDYTVYVRGCKAPAGRKLTCVTRSPKRGNYNKVTCPAGYTVTGCGVNNHYRKWNKKSGYESHFPHGNNQCHCDTAFGSGDNTCYARCCKLD